MSSKPSIERLRAMQKTEKAKETYELWEAVVAINEALKAAGGPGIDPLHIRRAQSYIMRAGIMSSGDLPDDVLMEIANVGGSRAWEATMGLVYLNETVFTSDGTFYICTQPHQAQAGWKPGSEGGRTLFRIIRTEPEGNGSYLDFVWGELVPCGTVRRDLTDGKLYTPINAAGVTLYEPHYPHLVPSEYKLFTPPDGEEGSEPTPPRWADLAEGHTFNVGDCFTDYGKTYVVLRQFNKQVDYRPPALNSNFYEEATA